MADISYFQNADLEDPSDAIEEEIDDTANDQRRGIDGDKGEKGEKSVHDSLNQLFWQAKSEDLEKRQLIGKLLILIFQNAVKSNIPLNADDVFPPLNVIFYDPEYTVRSSLVECLPHVLLICRESPFLFADVQNRILGLILIYLRDTENQVRQDAQAALTMLLERELVTEDQVENDICNVIIELSKDEYQESQTLALTLMIKVHAYIGDDLAEQLFLDRYLELCSSKGFFVRRVCASLMGNFCTMMSKKTVHNKLLQTYANLCRDSVWDVRKTSVDVMMLVARRVPLSMRRDLLSKLLVEHLCDESRWVKHSAYEILGPFISTFAKQFHELMWDQKGELIIVHEKECGLPIYNVVPIAKAGDILSENLVQFEKYYRKSPMRNTNCQRYRFNDIKILRKNRYRLEQSVILDVNNTDEYEKFNLFQYYYDPPDMHLDPALVESIINDNSTAQSEQALADTDSSENNKNYKEPTDQSADSASNNPNIIEDSEHTNFDKENNQDQDSNENITKNEHNQQEQDSNEKENSGTNEQDENWQGNVIFDYVEDVRIKESEETFKEDENDDEEPKDRKIIQDLDKTVEIDCEYDSSYESNMSRFKTADADANEQYNFSDGIVPNILVDLFVSMAELQSDTTDVSSDLDYHCAFSFPAVVLTLGKKNWHRLKGAYQRLASAVAWKVRSTLASSIHEIAIIIEKDYAARDLVPIYNGFIKDLDEVRIGALKHFSTFLEVLSPQDRMQYLPKLNDFLITDSKWNWRLREELVKQLSEIIRLYQRTDVAQYIAPLLLHLMQDRVAAVRQAALNAVARTVAYLANREDDPLAIAMIQEMRDLLILHAEGRWIIRQTYVLVCSKLIINKVISGEVFLRELLPYLLELSNDNVPNVRLVVARTLARDVVRIPDFPKPEIVHEMLRQKIKAMQSDCDRDVRIFASEFKTEKFY